MLVVIFLDTCFSVVFIGGILFGQAVSSVIVLFFAFLSFTFFCCWSCVVCLVSCLLNILVTINCEVSETNERIETFALNKQLKNSLFLAENLSIG